MNTTISRRKILSRSRADDLNQTHSHRDLPDFYDDIWFSHEQLFKDHIAEVLRKWDHIDDEIWAKMIFMSKNRRIAKAYIRLPTVIIDGSQNGFDGYRVGLNGFEDPFKDSQTDRLMSQIGKGCRIGVDDCGDIFIKRYSHSNIFVHSYPIDYSQSCVDDYVIEADGRLEANRKYLIFDMSKYEASVINEMRNAYPNRGKLQQQSIVIISFVRNHINSILEMPIYIMLINIVALDMLKSKLSPGTESFHCKAMLIKLILSIVLYHSIQQRDINRIRIPEFVSVFEPLRKSYWSDDQHNDTLLLDDLNYRKNRFDNIDREKFIKLDRDLNLKAQTSAEQNRYLKPLPKLPPRDRIKVGPNFHEFLETPRRSNQCQIIKIPSPDYPDNAKSPNNNNETFNFGTLSKEKTLRKKKTTSRNRRKPSSSNEIESILRVNLPMKVSTIRLMSVSKTVIVRYESPNFIKLSMQKTVDRKTSSSRAVAVSSRTLHKNDYNNLIHLNEDPYYSGLKARVTSERNEIASENVTNGTKKDSTGWLERCYQIIISTF
ncbi:hypothetical protein SSS_03053 [Sarcoptes scabiei]|uniref:MH2 domain-containing protein n=1 Tax=Sarcoptes scabiei TaxID=52283 RepID=A0A834R8C2_SARSC|nr:hypothetical protein SSS_03053 [Sarcoptes scabiei]